ncbi:MAG: flagellar protein FlgN [Desulfobulbaceae bacterium]|nr:MAG: flagellar protein FlgN [Desulfobulbaceae bacterium]
MRQKIPGGIFDLLARELTLSRDLLSILDLEQAALVAMNLNELISLSRRKAEHLEVVREIDEQLRLQVEQFTGAGSSAEKAVRLSDLIELVNDEKKATLAEQCRELVELRQEVAAKSVINHNFVEETKRHIHDAISLITSAVGEQPFGYGKAGYPAGRGIGRPNLISREV